MRRTVVIAIFVAMLSVAPIAVAQTPIDDAYGGEGSVLGDVAGSGDETPSGARAPTGSDGGGTIGSGALPFTGLDVLLLVAGGSLLIGCGAAIRRLARVAPRS